LDNKSYVGCDLPSLNARFESEMSDDYVDGDESNDEGAEQNTSGLKNSFESTCNKVGSGTGVVQTTSDENGHCLKVELRQGFVKSALLNSEGQDLSQRKSCVEDGPINVRIASDVCSEESSICFKNEDEQYESYTKLTPLISEGDGQILSQRKSSVEDGPINVGIANNVDQSFNEEPVRCFKKEAEVYEDDISQLKNYVDERVSTKGRTPVDKLDTVKSIGGSKRAGGGATVSEVGINGTDGSIRNTGCSLMDKQVGGIYMDNMDMKGTEEVSRVNEGVCGSREDDCVASNNDTKTTEGMLNYGPRRHDTEISRQTLGSSDLLSTISSSCKEDAVDEEMNCFDNETPTRSVAVGEENLSESSDEELEEIVYKGDTG
jgi:hypothetical protein